MEKTLTIIVSIVFVGFLVFVLYSMITNFERSYQKNSDIENRVLRVIAALLSSALVGFFMLNGVEPDFQDDNKD